MRSKDPELMNRISEYIGEYYRKNHATPSTREIAAAVGISPASGYNYLVAMDKRGMLSYEDGEITNLPKITKTKSQYISAPIVGSIQCGDPETEEEYVEEYVSLPESIFGKGPKYILRAVGNSMEDAGIFEDDLIVISQTHECCKGDIVVALDENGQNTLKVFGGIDKRSGKAILEYRNQAVYGKKRILVKELVVQGVAKHVIKAL